MDDQRSSSFPWTSFEISLSVSEEKQKVYGKVICGIEIRQLLQDLCFFIFESKMFLLLRST